MAVLSHTIDHVILLLRLTERPRWPGPARGHSVTCTHADPGHHSPGHLCVTSPIGHASWDWPGTCEPAGATRELCPETWKALEAVEGECVLGGRAWEPTVGVPQSWAFCTCRAWGKSRVACAASAGLIVLLSWLAKAAACRPALWVSRYSWREEGPGRPCVLTEATGATWAAHPDPSFSVLSTGSMLWWPSSR